MDIFNGFSDKNKVAQAKAQRESVEQLTAQAEKDVQTLVKKTLYRDRKAA